MNFTESLQVALFCMCVTSAVLTGLWLILKAFAAFFSALNGKNEPSEPMPGPVVAQPASPFVPPSDPGLVLEGVDEPTAAVIMAVVSHESGIDLSELRFKSIKLLNR